MPSDPTVYNSFQGIGNAGQDCEVKYLESGTVIANFTIALWQGKDKPSTWLPVKCFKGAAEFAANHIRKGSRVQVLEGKMAHDEWNDKQTGAKRTKLYVLAFKLAILDKEGNVIAAQDDAPAPADDYDYF